MCSKCFSDGAFHFIWIDVVLVDKKSKSGSKTGLLVDIYQKLDFYTLSGLSFFAECHLSSHEMDFCVY